MGFEINNRNAAVAATETAAAAVALLIKPAEFAMDRRNCSSSGLLLPSPRPPPCLSSLLAF